MSYYEQEPPFSEPGPKATFNISVESFDTSTFYQDVVRAVVDRILGKNWSEAALEKRINEAVQDKVLERLDATIDKTVKALLTSPIQKYDTFGHPVGEPLSVETIVRNGTETYLTESVDSNGRPTRDNFGGRKTRLERIVEQNVVDGLSREIAEEAKKVRAEVVKRAQEAAAAVLAGVK